MGTAILDCGTGLATPELRAPALELRDLPDRAALAALEGEWNALVEATRPEPFYRHEYIRSHLDSFAPGARLKIVTGRDRRGRLVLALPLVAGRGSLCGLPVRELASPTNVHSLRFDLVAEDAARAGEAVLRHLAADPGWDVVRITDVPEGGQAWQIYQAARAAGFPAGAWESQRSPYVALPAGAAAPGQGQSAKFKANLRRRARRLAERGEVGAQRLAGTALSEEQLEECFLLERGGWKGRQGSAVSQSEAAHGFHLALLRAPALREQLSLFRLTLDGRTIAFHYGLTAHGVYSLLVTSYDERFKDCSPGHLLTQRVLEDCAARGLRELDFLGCDLPWKLDWTSAVRPHHWLFIFRDSARGRALWQLKFGWGRAARQALGRWRARWSGGRPAPTRSP